jgi:hypothetical protein
MIEEEREKELLEEIVEGNETISQENRDVLKRMLIISCVLSIAKEGVEQLKEYEIFKQSFKNKITNFDNFMNREIAGLVKESYELDPEMHAHLYNAMSNYIEANFTGLINAEPKEIIGRYYDPSK